MTWEIVVGLIALVGAVVTIGSIISNNTKAMTEVKCSIDNLNNTVKGQDGDIRHLYDVTNDHETRLVVIEKGAKSENS